MKVVIINKSDSRGGAAVVSFRLMQSLRKIGVDASMLVAERLTDDVNVHLIEPQRVLKRAFLRERLHIFTHNGLNRNDLFKADIATTGVPLHDCSLIKDADVVVLGWINQGMLSLDEIEQLACSKPLVWIMHDMWCATGLCHHAGLCTRYCEQCGNCPLLHWMKSPSDLSHHTWQRKKELYAHTNITFVAVSNWLKERCGSSSLMRDARVEVIGNPFLLPEFKYIEKDDTGALNMLMVAARLDDTIKGLDTLRRALEILRDRHPALFRRMHLTLLGSIKNKNLLASLPVKYDAPGAVSVTMIEPFYRNADMVLSPSSYETLPGTLVEAQVYGALPVAFDSGGQRDIVMPGLTGVLAYRHSDPEQTAKDFAQAIVDAAGMLDNTPRLRLAKRMYANVEEKFSSEKVAHRYLDLFKSLF